MENLIKCDSCRCKSVCKECSNFELYVKQYLECRKNSVLFDKDPKCPYYIENEENVVVDFPTKWDAKKIADGFKELNKRLQDEETVFVYL